MRSNFPSKTLFSSSEWTCLSRTSARWFAWRSAYQERQTDDWCYVHLGAKYNKRHADKWSIWMTESNEWQSNCPSQHNPQLKWKRADRSNGHENLKNLSGGGKPLNQIKIISLQSPFLGLTLCILQRILLSLNVALVASSDSQRKLFCKDSLA